MPNLTYTDSNGRVITVPLTDEQWLRHLKCITASAMPETPWPEVPTPPAGSIPKMPDEVESDWNKLQRECGCTPSKRNSLFGKIQTTPSVLGLADKYITECVVDDLKKGKVEDAKNTVKGCAYTRTILEILTNLM